MISSGTTAARFGVEMGLGAGYAVAETEADYLPPITNCIGITTRCGFERISPESPPQKGRPAP